MGFLVVEDETSRPPVALPLPLSCTALSGATG
jgi:hypothetical protein